MLTAFKHALHLQEGDDEERLRLACSFLRDSGSRVLFEDQIALWREGEGIVGAVIDPVSGGPDTPERYQESIELYKRRFDRSSLRQVLREIDISWIVIRDNGTGTMQLRPKC